MTALIILAFIAATINDAVIGDATRGRGSWIVTVEEGVITSVNQDDEIITTPSWDFAATFPGCKTDSFQTPRRPYGLYTVRNELIVAVDYAPGHLIAYRRDSCVAWPYLHRK